jgi:hypothetical protein
MQILTSFFWGDRKDRPYPTFERVSTTNFSRATLLNADLNVIGKCLNLAQIILEHD